MAYTTWYWYYYYYHYTVGSIRVLVTRLYMCIRLYTTRHVLLSVAVNEGDEERGSGVGYNAI